jgi:hypothetical protein
MTELDKFSKNGAVSYSNAAKERETLNVENAADRIIKYIASRYEGEIKAAIDRNYDCRKIEMSLPRACNPRKLSSNEAAWGSILNELGKRVNKHFSELGFHITLVNGNSCRCLFDCICNRGEFVAKIVWA